MANIRHFVKELTYAGSMLTYVLPAGTKRVSIVVDTPDATVEYAFINTMGNAVKIQPGDSHTPIDIEVTDNLEAATTLYITSDVNPTALSLLCMRTV